MLNQVNIKLNNFGPIANADMDIGKINIIGGHNSTGKSTCSKILYSILRANSKSRKFISETSLVPEVLQLTIFLANFTNSALEDDEDVDKVRNDIKEILDEMKDKLDDNVHPDKFGILEYYNKINNIYRNLKIKEDYKSIIDTSFSNVQKLVDIYNEDGDELFKSLMNQLTKNEFGKNTKELQNVHLSGKFNDKSFDYKINICNSNFDIDGWFIVDEVFYFDSFSVFDLVSRGGSDHTEHITHIKVSLDDDESSDWGDEILNNKLIEIENNIMDITGGRFVKDDKNVIFISDEKEFLMKNTSSGIKQLGIIQMLLNNRKLTENSFLIIDEPEVNLHPEWQFKLAEILVILAKDLNINIYINTHSPMFIESMEVFTRYYNLEDETNFYLTEIVDGSKFNVVKYDYDNLYEIYDDLAKPFDAMEVYRLKAEYRKENGD